VVAEERSRRLSVIDPVVPCSDCDVEPIMTVDLSERPHNLTGVGSVVYATHPAAGAISRVDLATGDVLTAPVGREPHDVKYAEASGTLYVADEAGRQLLIIDFDTLDVLATIDLPAEPHDMTIAGGVVWVTLIGRSELVRVDRDTVDMFPTVGSPHDLIVDASGRIWFSNWNSKALNIFDPADASTVEAPTGVSEPQHFAVDPDGNMWVSDNRAGAVIGFGQGVPVIVEVGPLPHHLAFVADVLVVAVGGSGEAVLAQDGQIVARSQLTPGLHGVAIVQL
jgi:DNA-binding beta-propeller fold protein YncE